MRKWWFFLFAIGIFGQSVDVRAQNEGATRHIWDMSYSAAASDSPSSRRRPAKRLYRIATPRVPVAGVTPETVIGVTLWRLRPSRPADRGERIIAHENADSVEWTPERVSSDSRLAEGDRVRISIEAARSGYLYVIDREAYADGSVGNPTLIFPTTRTLGGDNKVDVGRVVEIPGQDDKPPFFTLRRRREDHVGENVTVIVSPTPIEGLRVTDQQLKLTNEQVADWERVWGGNAGRLEMENGAGRTWTSAEKRAGADATRSLTRADPVPQTIFYSPGVSRASAMLVKLQLKYSLPSRRSSRRRGSVRAAATAAVPAVCFASLRCCPSMRLERPVGQDKYS